MNIKLFLAVILGNTLEYFDFLLFAHFSLLLSPLFFPIDDPLFSSIISLGLFAIAFITRPLGGIFFGLIGDRLGRKIALSTSVLWVIVPTLGISLLPTYQQIGFFAPLGLLICRILQGISLGGEYTNAGVLLMEHTPQHTRGIYSGFLCAAGTIGSLFALGCTFLVVHSPYSQWLWRIPFAFGALLGFTLYRCRKFISETPEFLFFAKQIQNDRHSENTATSYSLKTIIFSRAFWVTMGIGALVGVSVWIPATYTSTYLVKMQDRSLDEAMWATFLALFTYALFLPIMGRLGDMIGHRKMMTIGALSVCLLAYPLFICLIQDQIVLFQIAFSLLASCYGASIHPIMTHLFPAPCRCFSISLGFSLGMSLFGGTSPMISATLIKMTGNVFSPVLYIILVGSFGLWAAINSRNVQSLQIDFKEV